MTLSNQLVVIIVWSSYFELIGLKYFEAFGINFIYWKYMLIESAAHKGHCCSLNTIGSWQ